VGLSGDPKGFRTPCDETIPLTRRLRAPGEVDGESLGLDHDVSSMTGEELTPGRLATGIMWPRWQTGHSRRERPVSLSYRSRDHVAAMANGAFPQRTARESLVSITVVLQRCEVRGTFSCRGHAEKLAALLQLLLAMRIGKESVVANAVEPARQNVQEEASDELVC